MKHATIIQKARKEHIQVCRSTKPPGKFQWKVVYDKSCKVVSQTAVCPACGEIVTIV